MAEIYHFVRREHPNQNCRESCYEGCQSMADHLKESRRVKEHTMKLEVLTHESKLLRQLMLLTDDEDRRDAYTNLVAEVDLERLVSSRVLHK